LQRPHEQAGDDRLGARIKTTAALLFFDPASVFLKDLPAVRSLLE
jgi:hypothetical protein